MISFLTGKLRNKTCFQQILKEFVFFFNYSNWKKIVEKIRETNWWNYLMNSLKVFRLHYKATFIILVVASLLVTSRQYIGDPIDCIVEEIPNNVSVNNHFTCCSMYIVK